MDTTDLEDENPAVAALFPGLTPAALMEMAEDPDSAAAWARMDWYKHAVIHSALMASPNTPAAQRQAWLDHLKGVGFRQQNGAVQAQGAGFSISINIPQVGAAPAKTVTLEAAPPRQIEDDE